MSFQDVIAQVAEKAAQDEAQRARDLMIEINAKVFDRAAAYTNLVLFGGYAGGFAIWNFTRDLLSETAEALVALLLTVSLATFVAFTVFNMVIHTNSASRQRALVTQELPPGQFMAKMNELAQRDQRETVRLIFPIWKAALAIAVSTVLGAVVICLWVFVATLLGPLFG